MVSHGGRYPELFLFQLLLKRLLKLVDFRPYDELTIGLGSMFIEVILVIIFRFIKICERSDLRNDRRIECFGRIQFFLIMFGELLLFFVVIENCRAVLSARIVPLSIECRWIVCLPKNLS